MLCCFQGEYKWNTEREWVKSFNISLSQITTVLGLIHLLISEKHADVRVGIREQKMLIFPKILGKC